MTMARMVFMGAILALSACGSDAAEDCRVTNCHGLEVTCGFSEQIACTEEYQLGDRCRSHASCEVQIDDLCPENTECEHQQRGCDLVLDEGYTACKLCVEACLNSSQDAERQFQCESECQ